MLTFLRKNQKSLVLVVSILVIIAFIWLYNQTNFERLGDSTFGKIYGRTLTNADYQREARVFNLTADMRMIELLQALTAGAVSENDAIDRYIINVMVLRHEAAALGIFPSQDDLRAAIKSLPIFQTNAQFDPAKFAQFTQNFLLPRGFTEQQLEEVMRDNLRFQQVKKLAGSPAAASPTAMKEMFELRYGQVQPSVVRFDVEPLLAEIEVTDAEIKEFFEANQDHLQTEEKRKVQYAIFAPTEAQTNLQGKEKIAVLQGWANASDEFSREILEPNSDFEQLAKSKGATVRSSDWLTPGQAPDGIENAQAFSNRAFSLTEEFPNSDAFDLGEQYFVVHLQELEPVRPLTLEEATPRIRDTLKREKASNQLANQASEKRTAIQEAMASGQSWEEAAKAAGLEPVEIPPFSRMEPFLDASDSRTIMQESFTMSENEISEFVSTPEGGLLIYLKERLPIDEDAFEEQKPFLESALASGGESMLFREWLRVAREASNFRRAGAQ